MSINNVDQSTPPPWAEQLMARLASLEQSVQASQSVSTDPRVVVRAPGADLHPSPLMLERCPFIQEDFFQRPLPESERRRFVFECPKNVLREYDPPKLNKVPISGVGKQMDTQLSQLQYRLSGLTRPLDWFAYRLFHHDWDLESTKNHALDLVVAMHELLSDLASHITTVRTENMLHGINKDLDLPSSEHNYLLDPKEMVEHIKLLQSVKQATSGGPRPKKKGNRSRPSPSPQVPDASHQSRTSSSSNYHASSNADNQISHSASSGFQQRSNLQKKN